MLPPLQTKALRKGCKACSSADKRATLQHSQPLSQGNPVQPGTSMGLAGCLAGGPPCCPVCAAPPHLHTHPPIHLKVPVERAAPACSRREEGQWSGMAAVARYR